jgi:hypothetical protein
LSIRKPYHISPSIERKSAMTGVIARLILRYIAGALIARGLLAPADGDWINGDPDLEELVTAGVGFVLMIGTEWFYRLAKKYGWTT